MPGCGPLLTQVLLVGAGRMGAHHARVLAADPAVTRLWVTDTHPERARRLAATHRAFAVPRDEACPECLAFDAVVISSPTSAHGEAADWAAAGASVLVEKPLAADVHEAQRLCRPGVFVGHVERHNPALLAVGLEGIRRLHVQRTVARDVGDDVVTDLLVHDLDLLGQLAGPLEMVDARGDPWHHVTVEVAGEGVSATLEAGLTSASEARRSWEGEDRRGPFRADLARRLAWREGAVAVPAHDALEAQWVAFREGRGVPAHEGLRVVELAECVLTRLRRKA